MLREHRKLLLPLIGGVAGVVVVAATVLGQAGGPYDLSFGSTEGSGGGLSTGGDYELVGAAGQHDAGVVEGGDYAIMGGVFSPGQADGDGTPTETTTEEPTGTVTETPTETVTPGPNMKAFIPNAANDGTE